MVLAREPNDRLSVSYKPLLVVALKVLQERTVEWDIRPAEAMMLRQEPQQRRKSELSFRWHPLVLGHRDSLNISYRLPMIFIGGVFIPTEASAPGLRLVSYLTPLTYMVDALREAMLGPTVMLVIDLTALAAWFVILEALAVVVLNKKTQL